MTTPRGAFQVTPECLLTPLLPVSLAAILAMPWSVRRRMVAVALVLPLFFALGVTRLIALALPAAIATTPLVIVHGFYQLVGGIALIGVASAAARHLTPPVSGGALRWRAGWSFAAGIAGAFVTAAVAGSAWTRLVLECAAVLSAVAPHTLTTIPPDAFQGALASLPAYHLGLLAGFWIVLTNARRPGRALIALCLLAAGDVGMLALIGAAQTHLGVAPHVLVIRAWAIGAPAALAWLLFVTPDAEDDPATYRRFWEGVGRDFPVLTGAASTDYYFRNETRLLSEQLPPLAGCRLLKSDLWDEAKNTQILQWAAAQGRARLWRRCVAGDCRTSARGVRTDSAGGQCGGCSLAAVRRRQLRRDLLDGDDRALCRVGGCARRDDPRPATRRPHRARRAEPVRPIRQADTRGRPVPRRVVCLWVREVVLPPPAARDASAVGGRGGRRDRHPFHAGVAAHDRSGITLAGAVPWHG